MKRIAIFSLSFLSCAMLSAQEKEITKDSFYLLSPVYRDLDLTESLKYKELCLTCNPNFPVELFD